MLPPRERGTGIGPCHWGWEPAGQEFLSWSEAPKPQVGEVPRGPQSGDGELVLNLLRRLLHPSSLLGTLLPANSGEGLGKWFFPQGPLAGRR